jgi:hypothetical protein
MDRRQFARIRSVLSLCKVQGGFRSAAGFQRADGRHFGNKRDGPIWRRARQAPSYPAIAWAIKGIVPE